MKLSFEGCVFDSDTRRVSREGRAVPLSPKAFALLELLIETRPNAVSKEDIRAQIWPSTFVSEANLANLVMELRTALGDEARNSRILRTVARFGYAFCAEDAVPSPGKPASAAGAGPAYRLIWGRREIALNPGANLIGRDQAAVVWIDDESVSRRHARIAIGEEGATLEDMGSKNGTYWKGRRICAATPLSDKDEVRFGTASMILRVLRRTGSTLSGMNNGRSR
jgi:DNA-binding winged helix-turn-helix (wHTH) protein